MDTSLLFSLVTRDEGEGLAHPACDASNEYDGRMGARISSIFVILLGSTLGMQFTVSTLPMTENDAGAVFPIYARRRVQHPWMEYGFFFAKYFGSGVIIATAFIHVSIVFNVVQIMV